MKLKRVSDRPVLCSRRHVRWEKSAVFNPGVFFENGVFHLFYRAIYSEGARGDANRVYDSCIGHARSLDGIHFQCDDKPALHNRVYANGEVYDPQDARVVKIDATYYMVYTNWKNHKIGVPHYAVSSDLDTWDERGPLLSFDDWGWNKNALLFPEKIGGEFVAFHRPEDPRYKHLPLEQFKYHYWSRGPVDDPQPVAGIALVRSKDLHSWHDNEPVLYPRPGMWDGRKAGSAAPPIRTNAGWLTVYHGIDENHVYRLGIALLDLDNPTKVLKRQDEPILEPELEWELHGDVPNVVFACGAVLLGPELWVYYGAADTVIGLAIADVTEFLAG